MNRGRIATKPLAVFLSLPLLLGGCSMWLLPSADQMRAIANDPATICFTAVVSIYGSISFDRNHGCGTAPSPIIMVTGGPSPIHVETIKP